VIARTDEEANMSASKKPPFRADHVGSLLRPKALLEARERAAKGAITREALRALEDRFIREAVALQEEAGLQAITDGELRRGFWHVDFLTGFDGIVATQSQYALTFKGEEGETAETRSMMIVNGRVRRSRPIQVEDFKFLRATTKRTPKLCFPAPTYLHMRGGRKVVDATLYPDIAEFWADMAKAYRAEIADLVAAGCTYLQLDDVSFAMLSDESIRAQIKRDGEDVERLPAKYAQVINTLIAGRPSSLTVALHTCRGNHQSMWMAEGGYDPIAEQVFATVDVDAFFLEYDTERAGGFEPLRFVPRNKKVVLGLVSTKKPALESKDMLKRRIEQASKFVPLENLCLSPQCGFGSTSPGNRISEDDERKKLELVVEVAREVWGDA
jgi:5-methyltetrahydropteroyltriglutamate--homocysteine methyltransferase